MRSEEDVNRSIELYSDMVRRICFCNLKDSTETEDVFQDVFLKYYLYDGEFESEEHRKAWFIRVAVNACKDHIKGMLRHRTVPLEAVAEEAADMEPEIREVLSAVLSMPEKYRAVIYLHYYEGYTAAEISGILGKRKNTIYSHLSRGRAMLKKMLGDDGYDG